MWQENHISKRDQIVNDVGCVFITVSGFVAFFVMFLVSSRFISTQKKRPGATPLSSDQFTGERGVHQ